MAEVSIDLDGPAMFGEHLGGLGAEPGPIHGGGGEVGIGKPAAFDGEFGGLFFGEGEEEAVGGIGGEVGEGELGEMFDGTELGSFVACDGGLGARFDEGEFVRAVADDRAGDEPGVAVLHLKSLEEKLHHAGSGGFFGDFEVEGGFVNFGVFLNRFRGVFDGRRGRRGATSPHEAGEGIGAGGAEEGGGGMRAKGAEVASAGGVEGPVTFGFGPEIDLGIMVIGATGEEIAVIDFLEVEGGEEAGRGKLFPVGEDVLVETMIPIRVSEEGFEI